MTFGVTKPIQLGPESLQIVQSLYDNELYESAYSLVIPWSHYSFQKQFTLHGLKIR